MMLQQKTIILVLWGMLTVQAFAQSPSSPEKAKQFVLTLQTRDSVGDIFVRNERFRGSEMALIVVDMWDKHWCETFTRQSKKLIDDLNVTLEAARELGIQVIFAPSETVGFYEGYPQRERIQAYGKVKPLELNVLNPPPLPWGRTGGCECGPDRPCKERPAWSRQHEDLLISDGDLISDDVEEIHAYCQSAGIKTLLFAGEAANMCVTWTRSFSVLPMLRYGYECVVLRDLTVAISGNGYDPDKKILDEGMTPAFGTQHTIAHIERNISPTVSGNQLLLISGRGESIRQPREQVARTFDTEYVKHYVPRGPTQSFRQLCYDYNWANRELINLPRKFSKSDPVAYAELSKKANMDAVLVLAVPHPGYTTHVSDYGELFPALQRDWFGEVVKELHARDISALGYVTLGANWKFMRAHSGLPQIRSGIENQGQFGGRGLCLNAPGYLDLVSNYSKELLTHYPIDGIRYDFMVTPYGCDCDGCKRYYHEVYGDEFTNWPAIRQSADSSRYLTFNIATLKRAANQLNDACRSVKPNVEVWQNHLDPAMEADINTGRLFDIAYVEYGTPFRLLALRGILDKKGIIVGQTLKSPIRRLIMALGARCYQYIKVDQETALPVGEELEWVEKDLSNFFGMVGDVQPYLEDATLASDVGILFSENTRYRFPYFDRKRYMEACERITNDFLASSAPIQFVNVLDLDAKDLSHLRMLVLPYTSGLTANELEKVKAYVKAGGNLVVMGDALLYDQNGQRLDNFQLAREMGVDFERNVPVDNGHEVAFGHVNDAVSDLTKVRPAKGTTLAWTTVNGERLPLVHVSDYGAGQLLYVASVSAEKVLKEAAADRFGALPLKVENGKQAILTHQAGHDRYILHLIDDGDYTVRIDKAFAQFRDVDSSYAIGGEPETSLSTQGDDWVIDVKGGGTDRLLVLK